MTRSEFLKIMSVAVGSMDTLTGLLLVFFPEPVLRMLGIGHLSRDAIVFVSWIGVFVMAVGLSYGLALGKRRGCGETVWSFTAMARLLVAAFVTTRILDGSLAKIWALVALVDAIVALVQISILRAGWWREGRR